ncbi:MAG: hypothetical protein ACTSV7_08670 [Candidatus Baldrarchaeia archaeon]
MVRIFVEGIHVIFKHLVKVGPSIPVQAFIDKLSNLGFSYTTRKLMVPPLPQPVPQPPSELVEYLFKRPSDATSLIVVSEKGFVVDTRSVQTALDLFWTSHGILRESLKERFKTIVPQMQLLATIQIYSEISPLKMIQDMLTPRLLKKKITMKKVLSPMAIELWTGIPKDESEWYIVRLEPFKGDPFRRMLMRITYKHQSVEEAVDFLERLETHSINLLQKIVKETK